MNEVTQRFIECYKYLKNENFFQDKKKFAEIIGVSTSLLTEIEKGRSNIGVSSIQNTVLNFNINAEWILTGKGSMLKNTYENRSVVEEPNSNINAVCKSCQDKERIIISKEETIESLKETVQQLKKNLEYYEEPRQNGGKKTA